MGRYNILLVTGNIQKNIIMFLGETSKLDFAVQKALASCKGVNNHNYEVIVAEMDKNRMISKVLFETKEYEEILK